MQPTSILVKIAVLIAVLSLALTACASPQTPIIPSPAADTPQPSAPTLQVATSTAIQPPTQEPQEPTSTVTSEMPIPIENLGLTFTYIGADGNLWIADASGGPPRQITTDASPVESGGNVVSYYFPVISDDGRYVAARRDAGVPVSEGIQY